MNKHERDIQIAKLFVDGIPAPRLGKQFGICRAYAHQIARRVLSYSAWRSEKPLPKRIQDVRADADYWTGQINKYAVRRGLANE